MADLCLGLLKEIKALNHPFYVKDHGFVNAGELYIGDKLLDTNGNILLVEDVKFETTKEPTTVYNFQVEDFHTYHVGEREVLVHNASYDEKVAQMKQNSEQGKAYEKQELAKLENRTSETVEQITIKTEDGTRFRIDAIGINGEGAVIPVEFKSSNTAPLTPNQKAGFPQLELGGGTVMGKGKGIFTGGYEIPSGTKVEIIRPSKP